MPVITSDADLVLFCCLAAALQGLAHGFLLYL